MGGIDPTVITHRLNASLSFKPIKQKQRSFAPERQKVINEEVNKLLQAGAIREVEYLEWLANVVLFKKENDKWRLCIAFTDINKTCSNDSFPLPQIDLIIDATTGHELLSFMDAFSGYNQINMDPDDQEKTSFVYSAQVTQPEESDQLRLYRHSASAPGAQQLTLTSSSALHKSRNLRSQISSGYIATRPQHPEPSSSLQRVRLLYTGHAT